MNRQENKGKEAVSVRLLISSISCWVRRVVRITEAKYKMGVNGICGSLVSGIVRREGTDIYPDILTSQPWSLRGVTVRGVHVEKETRKKIRIKERNV